MLKMKIAILLSSLVSLKYRTTMTVVFSSCLQIVWLSHNYCSISIVHALCVSHFLVKSMG